MLQDGGGQAAGDQATLQALGILTTLFGAADMPLELPLFLGDFALQLHELGDQPVDSQFLDKLFHARCQLLDGLIATRFRVRVKRAREVLFDGRMSSLRHFQEEVPEVSDLQECGIFFDGFEAFAEGDVVECYALDEIERTL